MRLLKPVEVNQALKDEQARVAKRAADTFKVLKDEEALLSRMRNEREQAIQKLNDQFVGDQADYAEKISALSEEVSILEKKRKDLLYSSDMQRVKERELAAQKMEQELKTRESLLEDWQEDLQEKENSLLDREVKIESLLKESASRKRFLDEEDKRLSREIQSVSAVSMNLMAREVAISAVENRYRENVEEFGRLKQMEESALQELKKGLEKEKDQIAKDRIAIADGYYALSKAREEILGRKT